MGPGVGGRRWPGASRSPGRTPLNAWTAILLSVILGLRLTNQRGLCACRARVPQPGARSPYRPAIGPRRCLPGGPVRVPPTMLPRRTRPVPDRPRVRRGPLNRPPCPRRPHRRRGPMELRPALASADWHRARDSPAAPGAPAPSSRRAIVRTGDGATGSGAGSVIYELIAAIGWGTSAIAATNAARRAGTYIAVLSGQGIGVAVLVVLAAFLRPSLGAIDPATA